jgi:heptosyltransferase-2
LACRPGLGDFFLQSGLADEVVAVDKKSAGGRDQALNSILAREWDIVFCPHESPRTALWMTRVKAKQKVGFRKWWNGFAFTKRVVKPMDFPDALRQLSLLAGVDSKIAEKFGSEEIQELRNPSSAVSPLEFKTPHIPEWTSMTLRQPAPAGKKIFLAPGSVWATKRWTHQGYRDLAKLLLAKGYEVELVGSPDEKALCQSIADEAPGVKNRCGETTLSGLVDLLATGTALVCNDSGAMHAAATVGLPTVAIFGPTAMEFGFRPWQNKATVLQRQLPCRPCAKHGTQKCPINTHECMTKIEAKEVLNSLMILLEPSTEH